MGIVNTKANALTKLLNKQNKIAKLSGPKVDVLSNAKSDVLSALYTKIVEKTFIKIFCIRKRKILLFSELFPILQKSTFTILFALVCNHSSFFCFF